MLRDFVHWLIIVFVLLALRVFPDRNLDTLPCEAFAQRRAFDDAWKLLRRVDLELVGVDVGEDRSSVLVQTTTIGIADIDEVHAQSAAHQSVIRD